jgi:hypothetical protein
MSLPPIRLMVNFAHMWEFGVLGTSGAVGAQTRKVACTCCQASSALRWLVLQHLSVNRLSPLTDKHALTLGTFQPAGRDDDHLTWRNGILALVTGDVQIEDQVERMASHEKCDAPKSVRIWLF